MKREATTAADLQLGRLTNPPCANFDEAMFTEYQGFQPDDRVLEQPCRLASRLLESGVADRLLKRIVFAGEGTREDRSERPRHLLCGGGARHGDRDGRRQGGHR